MPAPKRDKTPAMNAIPIPVRLSLCSAAVFAVMGLQLPFWPVWLEDHNVTPDGIGLLVALGYFTRVAVGPGISILADRIGDRRKPLIVSAILMLSAYLAFTLTGSFWSILVVSLIAYVGAAPMVPLKESIVMGYVSLKGYDYGRIRLWGSLAFVAMTLAGGAILGAFGTDGILTALIALCAVMVVAAIAVPADPRHGEEGDGTPMRLSAVWKLMTTPTFLTFLAAIAITQAAHAVYYAFGTLNWQRLGYSDTYIGFLWALGVLAEIVLFAFSARVMKRIPALVLIPIAGAAAVVRWALTALEPHWMLLVPLQCLHAFTFGALHLGAMHYIGRYVPSQVSGTAMGILAAVSGGLGIGLATIAAGPLYAAFHSSAYFAMAVLGGAGFVFAALLNLQHKGEDEGQIS